MPCSMNGGPGLYANIGLYDGACETSPKSSSIDVGCEPPEAEGPRFIFIAGLFMACCKSTAPNDACETGEARPSAAKSSAASMSGEPVKAAKLKLLLSPGETEVEAIVVGSPA